MPREMTVDDIHDVIDAFVQSAQLAVEAGFVFFFWGGEGVGMVLDAVENGGLSDFVTILVLKGNTDHFHTFF